MLRKRILRSADGGSFESSSKKTKLNDDTNDADTSGPKRSEDIPGKTDDLAVNARVDHEEEIEETANSSNEAVPQASTSSNLDNNSSSEQPKRHKVKVIIVGAGISGLGAAVTLKQAGADVTVLEAGSEPGGRLKSVQFPSKGRLRACSVDIGASTLIDCSDSVLSNPLYSLARFLGTMTMEMRGMTSWDCPLSSKMINSKGKIVNQRTIAKLFYLHQTIIYLGMMKVIRDAGFDIPEQSFVAVEKSKQTKVPKTSKAKKKKPKSKAKNKTKRIQCTVVGNAMTNVPKRGVFDYGDAEIEDIMEDIFVKLNVKYIIELGKHEFNEHVRPLNLSTEEDSIMEFILTQFYGSVLHLDAQSAWDSVYNVHSPTLGMEEVYQHIEGPNEHDLQSLVKQLKEIMTISKKMKPSSDEEIFNSEDRLLCDSSTVLVDCLAAKVNILCNVRCDFVYYKDRSVVVDCTKDGVRQSFDADFCIVTVPPRCLLEEPGTSVLQISPQMSQGRRLAISRIATTDIGATSYNKVILRFDKIFWEPDVPLITNPEARISIINYHKTGKENVMCIQIWPSSEWNVTYLSDEDLCSKCCNLLQGMFRKTYKPGIKLVGYAISRWNEDQFICGAYVGLPVGATSDDFVMYSTPLPSVENPRLCFAGEATIDVYNGPIQTAHGAFLTGVREARRISTHGGLREIPKGNELLDFVATDFTRENEREKGKQNTTGKKINHIVRCYRTM